MPKQWYKCSLWYHPNITLSAFSCSYHMHANSLNISLNTTVVLQPYISHYFWSSNSFSGLWESCTCGTVTIWYNLASSHDIITVFPPTNHWWCDQDKTTYHFQNIFTVEVSEIRSLGYQIQGTYVSHIPCEYSVYRSFPTFGTVTRSFLVFLSIKF